MHDRSEHSFSNEDRELLRHSVRGHLARSWPAAAVVHGRVEQLLRRSIMMVVGGGTAEAQCTLIAQRGLRLPR